MALHLMTERPKICVLGAASSPHVVTRAEAFAARGYDARLISPVAGESRSIPISFPKVNIRSLLGKIQLVLWTAGMLLRQRADIYHAHYAAEVGTWLAWLLRRRPLAISVMGGDILFDEQGSLGLVGRWLTRRALRGADLVTVKSPELADVVAEFGVAGERTEVVIWGVDHKVFRRDKDAGQAFRQEIGVAYDRPLVFSPRIMHPFYNIDLLVDAWPEVVRVVPDAVLAISEFGGDAEYKRRLTRQAEDRGVKDAVIFVPPRLPSQMPAAYSGADLVVSVPPSDGFPQAVLEAAACGCPVVLSDLARFHTFFQAENEVLYTAIDAASVAQAVISGLSFHEASRARAEAAARKVAGRADFDENADRVDRRFRQLLRRT